jgi:adenosylmethionine-8-amino-7-oxononanoate aminotransferase
VLCVKAIEDLILFHGAETIAAVVADPIPGANAAVPGPEYWPMLREICTRYGIVLIADEVITAWGRTGTMFALEHWDVVPDILTVAKGMSSAYAPIGAAIATSAIASAFAGGKASRPLIHALTFGGHPMSSAVALKNIEIIERENLPGNARTLGLYLRERLLEMQQRHKIIGCVQGIGLQVGLELVKDQDTKEPIDADTRSLLSEELKKRRLLVRAGDYGFTLYPPLSINKDEVDELVEKLDESLASVSEGRQ